MNNFSEIHYLQNKSYMLVRHCKRKFKHPVSEHFFNSHDFPPDYHPMRQCVIPTQKFEGHWLCNRASSIPFQMIMLLQRNFWLCTILPNFSVIISLKNCSRRFKNCKRNSRNMADFQEGLASQNRVLKFGGKVLRFLAKRVALQVFWQRAIVTHVCIFDKVIFHTDWLFLYHKKVSHFYFLGK